MGLEGAPIDADTTCLRHALQLQGRVAQGRSRRISPCEQIFQPGEHLSPVLVVHGLPVVRIDQREVPHLGTLVRVGDARRDQLEGELRERALAGGSADPGAIYNSFKKAWREWQARRVRARIEKELEQFRAASDSNSN